MELSYQEKHQGCLHYVKGPNPSIELRDLDCHSSFASRAKLCKIVYVLDGHLTYTGENRTYTQLQKGKLVLLPPDKGFVLSTATKARLVIIRLNNALKFCEYCRSAGTTEQPHEEPGKNRLNRFTVTHSYTETEPYLLTANQGVKLYMEGLRLTQRTEMCCKQYFDIKVREVFYLFRTFYTKEELGRFFAAMLKNPNASFYYYIISNYRKYKRISDLAADLNMSKPTFDKRFKAAFKTTAYQWLKDQRLKEIQMAIQHEDTPMQELAVRFGFASKSSFSDFCLKHCGERPSKIRNSLKGG